MANWINGECQDCKCVFDIKVGKDEVICPDCNRTNIKLFTIDSMGNTNIISSPSDSEGDMDTLDDVSETSIRA